MAIQALTTVHYYRYYNFFQNLKNLLFLSNDNNIIVWLLLRWRTNLLCYISYIFRNNNIIVWLLLLWYNAIYCCVLSHNNTIIVSLLSWWRAIYCYDRGEDGAWLLLSYISHLADHCRAIDSLYSWTAIQLRICQYCITIYVAC